MPPPPPPEARVASAIAAWGQALQRDDVEAIRDAEDGAGRAALVYVAVKAAAGQVAGGAQAVETSVAGTLLLAVLMRGWPGAFGTYPDNAVLWVLPTGALSPLLVDAGIAAPFNTPPSELTIVEVPWDQTLGRLEAASARHREELRAREAWTCRPTRIERTILPTEPSLVRAATLSPHVFGGWLERMDATWMVRADCASGPGLFVVTGHVDRDGAVDDRILVAVLAPPTT